MFKVCKDSQPDIQHTRKSHKKQDKMCGFPTEETKSKKFESQRKTTTLGRISETSRYDHHEHEYWRLQFGSRFDRKKSTVYSKEQRTKARISLRASKDQSVDQQRLQHELLRCSALGHIVKKL